MASGRNPQHLVALMVKSVGVNHDHGQHHVTLAGSGMIGGMLQYEVANTGTFPMMEACANICGLDG